MVQPKVIRDTVEACDGGGLTHAFEERYIIIAAGILSVFKEPDQSGNPYGQGKMLDIHLGEATSVESSGRQVTVFVQGSFLGFFGSSYMLRLKSEDKANVWAAGIEAHMHYAKHEKGAGISQHYERVADAQYNKHMDKLWDKTTPQLHPHTSEHPKSKFYDEHIKSAITPEMTSAASSRRTSKTTTPTGSFYKTTTPTGSFYKTTTPTGSFYEKSNATNAAMAHTFDMTREDFHAKRRGSANLGTPEDASDDADKQGMSERKGSYRGDFGREGTSTAAGAGGMGEKKGSWFGGF